MTMAKQKVVLDANVLYDGFLRNLLLSIFAAKMHIYPDSFHFV
jgi:hypothetical protein